MPIKTFKDLDIYNLSYKLAMDIFNLAKTFPTEEKFSLISQITRSSRSICANISEWWGKRKHENVFKKFLVDSCGSIQETKTWLDFAHDCNYISGEQHKELMERLEVVGGKLWAPL